MKPIIAITVILLSVLFACHFTQSENKNHPRKQRIISNAHPQRQQKLNAPKDQHSPRQGDSPTVDTKLQPHEDLSPAPNHSDAMQSTHNSLDQRIIEYARSMQLDPRRYRMPIRTEADGTKIYRMLGMHIIVNPNGTEYFLPDHI